MSITSPEVDVRPIEIIETEGLTHTDTTDGEPPTERHIIRPADNEHLLQFVQFGYPKAADILEIAMSRGLVITALCGKTWVPTRDPGRYPVCPTCKEILDAARAMRGGG